MKNARYLFVVCLCFAAMHGCMASQPTKFYLLSPAGNPGALQECPGGTPVTIGVGPARLAKYLDRPQIMTREGPNEVRLSELDHWAEPLGDNLSSVLAQNLESLLCAEATSLAHPGQGQTDYRVMLEVIRFDGSPGGEAVLDARWSVFAGAEEKPLFSKEARFALPVPGHEHEALVSVYSSLVAMLSSEVAGFFRSIQQ
jgi:uncharacterized protein